MSGDVIVKVDMGISFVSMYKVNETVSLKLSPFEFKIVKDALHA